MNQFDSNQGADPSQPPADASEVLMWIYKEMNQVSQDPLSVFPAVDSLTGDATGQDWSNTRVLPSCKLGFQCSCRSVNISKTSINQARQCSRPLSADTIDSSISAQSSWFEASQNPSICHTLLTAGISLTRRKCNHRWSHYFFDHDLNSQNRRIERLQESHLFTVLFGYEWHHETHKHLGMDKSLMFILITFSSNKRWIEEIIG
jgi:hypothetical protein